MEAPIMVERTRKTTIPAGTLTAADVAAAAQMQAHQVASGPPHQPTAPVAHVDPQTMLLMEGLALLKGLSKQPQNRGPVFAGITAGLIAGILAAVVGVFIHDQTTRGTVTDRLDDQDKRLGTVIVVMEGMLDEGEDDMEWMERALAAGFGGRPIPERGASRRKELRRTLSRQ